MLVDSHCHFNLMHAEQGDVDQIIARAKENGVQYFLNVCVDLATFPEVLKTAEQYPFMSASLGVHPNEPPVHPKEHSIIHSPFETRPMGAPQSERLEETLLRLGAHPKVIGIGETGLDYFRSTGDLTWQHERFRTHIRAAKKLQKPLIIHTRQAKEDTIRIMQEEKAHEAQGVMHCFSEDWETAKKALEMDFYISFSGTVTFKSAQVLQAVAKVVPLDRLLIETDAPYLAPHPLRGKPNEPAYVRYTAEYIANLRGIAFEQLAEQTTHNFFTLFKGALKAHV